RPDPAVSVMRSVLALELADELAHVAGKWLELRCRSCAGRTPKAFAAQQRAQTLHPAAPGKLPDDNGDERDHRAQRNEEIEQIAPRFGAPIGDEARIVDNDQIAARIDGRSEGGGGQMQTAEVGAGGPIAPRIRINGVAA